MEAGIWRLPQAQADEIRFKSVWALRRTDLPKNSVSSAELWALWELRVDDSIIRRDTTVVVLRRGDFLIKQSSLVPDVKAAVWCSEALPPRLYDLPKIHKANVLSHPIVSDIGLPTYNLAKHLTKLLWPHIGHTESYVYDSTQFLRKLGGIVLNPGDVVVSFDVISVSPEPSAG